MGLFDKEDPLIKVFLNKYGMNLLSIPREDIAVGDLYVFDKHLNAVSSKGSIKYFLIPEPEIPPITSGASMADITGTTTTETDFKGGLNFASGFLEKLGVGSVFGKVKAGFQAKGATTIKFKFPMAFKDSADSMLFGKNIMNSKPIPHHPFYSKDNRYLLVMAVAKTSSISITAQDKSNKNADINVEALKQELAKAKAKVDKTADSTITFSGDKSLGFAVELQELFYDEKTNILRLAPVKVTSAVKAAGIGEKPERSPEIDSVFIEIK